jgi:hypothetical protein
MKKPQALAIVLVTAIYSGLGFVALSGCQRKEPETGLKPEIHGEFSFAHQWRYTAIMTDRITGCEYILFEGRITPRLNVEGKAARGCLMVETLDESKK